MTDNQNATLLHLFAIGNVFEGQHNDSSESDLQWRNQQKIGDTGQLSQWQDGPFTHKQKLFKALDCRKGSVK